MKESTNWLFTTPIAHRGLHTKLLPENSMGAFFNAIDHGYPIELDLQLTSDNVLMVFHDYSLKRMTGDDRLIRNVTAKEASTLKLGDSNFTIPTFKEFLEKIDGKVPLLIEIKNSAKIGIMEDLLIKELKDYNGEYAVQAFNPFAISYIADNAPHIMRGLLTCNFIDSGLSLIKRFLLKHMFFLKKSKAQFLSVKWDDKPYKRYAKKKLPIIAWTISSQKELLQAKEFASNVIFENFIPE